ncbi:ABC transporter ATP-binding protein [uncultured Selenomonas sp.]|uniref:ABC transporter ATP-binding protein n=1 Tax=uncultured Selenomonas sp. TaxID=159275 RepID=UPI0025FDD262|nr:ABC transporter ATP-binding protein [uncultured Selenomonas sp.]
MSYISIQNVSRTYHDAKSHGRFTALDHVSLDIEQGEFICLLGPSGCGKSTLLDMLAGFSQPSTGTIRIAGEPVTEPSIRRITIFQNYGLLPWRTVAENVELGLETLGLPPEERHRTAAHYLAVVGLEAFRDRHPAELSGGMQQRVAIARALAVDPDILFMDEPFAALDAITRMKLQDEIAAISREQHKTIIFVTHDIEESIVLADRIVVMTPNPGKIKTILPVDLHGTARRDRTSPDFLHIRERVFEAFALKPEDKTEYYI